MKYKEGNRVRAKSLDWYNENKNKFGKVWTSGKGGQIPFDKCMSKWCGKVMTISDVRADHYTMIEDLVGYWTDEMIEGLVEEGINIDVAVKETTKDISDKVVDTIMGGLMVGKSFNLPQGYQFKDENGNVINATKIVLEKKKKEYPKTYEECYCVLLERASVRNMFGYKADLMVALQKLLVCRDAYWKIAGEEMGLGKPWEPDWKNRNEKKWVISRYRGELDFGFNIEPFRIFAFPTKEMRDAFYENFKELIEQCKELL